MKVYDAKGIVLGRLASHAAKDALLGEDVVIVKARLSFSWSSNP